MTTGLPPTPRARPETRLLHSPIDIAGMTLPNRIVMPPMGTGLASLDGHANDETVAYYRRRALGGVGMVCVEASLIAADLYGVGPELRLHGDEVLPGRRRLADAIHEGDIPAGVQLWHPGRQTTLGRPVAPSPIPLGS